MAWKLARLVSDRMPTRLITRSASRTAAATDSSLSTLPAIGTIWPTEPLVRRKLAWLGWRTATRITEPVLASRLIRWRPMKPDPPNTVATR
jgi:hypothetical protein